MAKRPVGRRGGRASSTKKPAAGNLTPRRRSAARGSKGPTASAAAARGRPRARRADATPVPRRSAKRTAGAAKAAAKPSRARAAAPKGVATPRKATSRPAARSARTVVRSTEPARASRVTSRAGADRDWRVVYAEMQRSARGLESSIGDVRDGLRHAEREIREQARSRILGLRRDVERQVKGLRERQREAVGKIERVRGAAGESWVEIRRSFDAIVADTRATAASVAARLRRALLS